MSMGASESYKSPLYVVGHCRDSLGYEVTNLVPFRNLLTWICTSDETGTIRQHVGPGGTASPKYVGAPLEYEHLIWRRLVSCCCRFAKVPKPSLPVNVKPNQKSMLVLWRKLVLSRLDYCSQLWSPYTVALIGELKVVQ